MKFAIPLANGVLCMHFGHCQEFAIVDADSGSTERMTPPPHEPGVLPKWLSDIGVDIIIAGGMGSRAQNLFAQHGVQVVVGAPAETPEKLISQYLMGTLEAGQNVCDH